MALTLAQMLALLPDNTTGDISPEDMRDVVTGLFGFSGARVTKSATQSVSTSIETIITWDQETFDTDGYHDNASNNSRLTVPTDGFYLVGCNLKWAGGTSNDVILYIRVNATGVNHAVVQTAANNSGIGDTSLAVTTPLQLSAGDYVTAVAFSVDATRNVVTDATHFWIKRVGI